MPIQAAKKFAGVLSPDLCPFQGNKVSAMFNQNRGVESRLQKRDSSSAMFKQNRGVEQLVARRAQDAE